MRTLRDKIKSMMETDDPIINRLDYDVLYYINYLMKQLNRSGKQHSIIKIIRHKKDLDIETNFEDT